MNESELRQLKDALHNVNNALNAISMQTELARMYIEQGNSSLAEQALQTVMSECRRCGSISDSAYSELSESMSRAEKS
jgi:hypothetical protein